MRTYGKVLDKITNTYKWQQVTTDENGFNDTVWLTTLIQCLKLIKGESPFYANWGIDSQNSVVTQIFPDMSVMMTQQQFASYFASLIIAKVPNLTAPYYNVNVITNTGVRISTQIPV